MTKTVFISYSWDNEEHKSWVLNLANYLVENGIDVILDQFDLSIGNEMTFFMEKAMMADKILLILTPSYKTKADDRTGGVGYEYSLVTRDFYDKEPNKSKIIPILRSGDKDLSCPVFVQTKLFHNMSDDKLMDSKMFELIKIIVDEPLVKKPLLGELPDFDIENVPELDAALNKLKSKEEHANQKRIILNGMRGREMFVAAIDSILDFISHSLDYYTTNFNLNFTIAKNPLKRTIHFSTVNYTYYIGIERLSTNSSSGARIITNFFQGPVGFEDRAFDYQGETKAIYRLKFKLDLDDKLNPIFVQEDNISSVLTSDEIGKKAVRDVIMNEIKLRESRI